MATGHAEHFHHCIKSYLKVLAYYTFPYFTLTFPATVARVLPCGTEWVTCVAEWPSRSLQVSSLLLSIFSEAFQNDRDLFTLSLFTHLFLLFRDIQSLGKHFTAVTLDFQSFLQEAMKDSSKIQIEDIGMPLAPFVVLSIFVYQHWPGN